MVRNQEFPRAGVTGINIIGRKRGLADERPTYIMDAHYDGVSNTAGADDNGSGVVSFLEAMRVLAPYNFARSIDFIGFDFEESIS
jgi:Zn-dependent M28 family amino/carboxypeptidase